MIALKLPIGLSVLVSIGLLLLFTRRLAPEPRAGLAVVLAAALLFLLVLSTGSTYAGIRHALPVVVLLSIFGGFAIQAGSASRSRYMKAAVITALVAADVSALPVMRPWEYFNEIIGKNNAYLYFNDEGVGLGQPAKELAAYYHRVLEPSGEIPILSYGPMGEPEALALHLDWLGHNKKRDESRSTSGSFSGNCACQPEFRLACRSTA